MSAPRVVKVFGQRVEVAFVPDVEAALGNTAGAIDVDGKEQHGERVGHADGRFGLVHVATSQSDDQIADTYLHELLHIMLMYVGRDDEDLVFHLTPVLLDFMRRNPKAVGYLIGRRVSSRLDGGRA